MWQFQGSLILGAGRASSRAGSAASCPSIQASRLLAGRSGADSTGVINTEQRRRRSSSRSLGDSGGGSPRQRREPRRDRWGALSPTKAQRRQADSTLAHDGVQSKEQRAEELRRAALAFRRFDTNGDGELSLDEIREVMHEAGKACTEPELQARFKSMDGNGNVRRPLLSHSFPHPKPFSPKRCGGGWGRWCVAGQGVVTMAEFVAWWKRARTTSRHQLLQGNTPGERSGARIAVAVSDHHPDNRSDLWFDEGQIIEVNSSVGRWWTGTVRGQGSAYDIEVRVDSDTAQTPRRVEGGGVS
jgi:hypothetical protein